MVAVIRSRGVAAKKGFLKYYTKGDAIGTKVSVRYRESGRLSGVVVRGVPLYIVKSLPIHGVNAIGWKFTGFEAFSAADLLGISLMVAQFRC